MAAFWLFERTFKTSCDKMCLEIKSTNAVAGFTQLESMTPSVSATASEPSFITRLQQAAYTGTTRKVQVPEANSVAVGAIGIKHARTHKEKINIINHEKAKSQNLKSKQEAHIEAYSTPTSGKSY